MYVLTNERFRICISIDSIFVFRLRSNYLRFIFLIIIASIKISKLPSVFGDKLSLSRVASEVNVKRRFSFVDCRETNVASVSTANVDRVVVVVVVIVTAEQRGFPERGFCGETPNAAGPV